MTDKEEIIIDGKKRDCKILFRCKHIDDTAAYDMMCEGIEIKPENAPVSDFELMLIENTNSPFGFSLVGKRNNKEDVWEYSGFGNSGACSIVTALLKQLTRKTQECEKLSILAQEESARNGYVEYELNDKLKQKTQECESLKQEIEILQNNYDTATRDCNEEIARLEQECEKLKEENQKLEMQLCNECGERDDYNIPCKMIRDLDYGLQMELEENDRYRKALEEIKELANCGKDMYIERGKYPDYEAMAEWMKNQFVFILNIINKAKENV